MIYSLPIFMGGAALLTSAAGIYYASYSLRSQWLGPTEWRGRSDSAEVALTFDDGPTRDTEGVLDVLGRFEVQATFFMLGRQVELYPEIARRIVSEGHEVGNHSYSHPLYLFSTPNETRRQLERAQEIIGRITGVEPRLSRPPCGVRTPSYFAATRRLGLRTVLWDVAGFDWKKSDAATIARNVLRRVSPGSVIMLHDGDNKLKNDRGQTVAALPIILDGLRGRGLRVAAISKLLMHSEQNPGLKEGSQTS